MAYDVAPPQIVLNPEVKERFFDDGGTLAGYRPVVDTERLEETLNKQHIPSTRLYTIEFASALEEPVDVGTGYEVTVGMSELYEVMPETYPTEYVDELGTVVPTQEEKTDYVSLLQAGINLHVMMAIHNIRALELPKRTPSEKQLAKTRRHQLYRAADFAVASVITAGIFGTAPELAVGAGATIGSASIGIMRRRQSIKSSPISDRKAKKQLQLHRLPNIVNLEQTHHI